MKSILLKRLVIFILSILFLSACGGSGDGSSSSRDDGNNNITINTANNSVTLTWMQDDTNFVYFIYRYENKGCTGIPVNYSTCTNAELFNGSNSGVDNPYTDTAVSNGAIYYYQITKQASPYSSGNSEAIIDSEQEAYPNPNFTLSQSITDDDVTETISVIYDVEIHPNNDLIITGEAYSYMKFFRIDSTSGSFQLDKNYNTSFFDGGNGNGESVSFNSNGDNFARHTNDSIEIWLTNTSTINNSQHINFIGVPSNPFVKYNSSGDKLFFNFKNGNEGMSVYNTTVSPYTKELDILMDSSLNINVIDLNDDDTKIAIGDSANNGRILIYDNTGNLLQTLNGHMGEVIDLEFNSDSSKLVSLAKGNNSSFSQNQINIFQLDNATNMYSLERVVTNAHFSILTSITIHPSGSLILTTAKDNTAKLWNIYTGDMIKSFSFDGDAYDGVFSSDGLKMIIGIGGSNPGIFIYNGN